MELGAFKPLLKALLLPPASLLPAALLGLLLVWRGWRRWGWTLLAGSLMALTLLSCNGFALWLGERLVPQPAAVTPEQLRRAGVQAVVILGGGLQENVAEYGGTAQPSRESAERLRYGLWLARQLKLPVAFAGGVGWFTSGTQQVTEGEMARRHALEFHGMPIRWIDDRSRDTVENARLVAPLLAADGIQRIALVTHAWHMPRALAAFRGQPLQVQAAPMGHLRPEGPSWSLWLPSVSGLRHSAIFLHEWLGLKLAP